MKALNNLRQKALLLLLLMAAAGAAAGQSYQSYFAADSTRLNVYAIEIDFDPTIYLTINSTDSVVINGNTYLQGFLHGVFAGFFYEEEEFYFREDTITGRLYRYFPLLDEEVLLCDMSLEVGDSFTFSDRWGSHQAVVNDVTFENGRKVIHFENGSYFGINILEFYEGIFPPVLPIGYFDYYYYTGCDFYLLCEYKDGEQVFDNPNFEGCFLFYAAVNENHEQENPTKVFPTSVRPNETVQLETSDPITEVALFDLIGRAVSAVVCQETPMRWNMTIPSRVSGVYVIKITTNKGTSYEKIIVNN